MIKHIAGYALCGVLIVFGGNYIFKLSNENQSLRENISTLKESQSAIITGYEKDIAVRDKNAVVRKEIVKQIVEVKREHNCLKTVLDDDIISKLRAE